MIHITNKKDCCGCGSCIQRCPRHCISLIEDYEGFLYPEVDISKCINCGLCEKACPLLNRTKASLPLSVFAVKNRNEDERMASSSGGIFIALAKEVLAKNGVVFGAIFDKNWEVRHTYTEEMDGVKAMMGSKYLQSRMENSYVNAEHFLKTGREVLFCGSPCQIAGLHKYLRKPYPNLLSVDFLCHGVPSPGVWRKYLNETFAKSLIQSIEFREKTSHGWKNFSFVIRGTFGFKVDERTILQSNIHRENTFMRGFLSNIYLRPSCYDCRCKNGVSQSDITIADYWGIHILMPDFDDNKGVGLVLVNTAKGKAYFNSLSIESRPSSLEDAKRFNGGFKESITPHPKREKFYSMIANGCSVTSAVNQCLKMTFLRKLANRTKRIIKKGKHIIK